MNRHQAVLTGEAARLVAWLEQRGLVVRTHPALLEGTPVLVVRAAVPGLGEAGLARDELWWPVSPEGDQVLLHPDVHEAQAWWVERALGRDPVRATPPADVTDRPQPPAEVSPRRWRRAEQEVGHVGPPARRPRGALWRFVAVMAGVAICLALLIPLLRTVRDVRSEGRAEEAASLLAPAVAGELAAGGEADEGRAAQLLREVVPPETREMRGRYARGDLQVGWVVRDPTVSDPGQAALCVEMRSLPGDDVYAAAWAVGSEVTRSQRGVGCGATPQDWEEASARAGD
ncbi:hypothetical protein [Nocardioides nanhaiensis]|uniref:Uncharacterized protein n=1 Tax=Nocardioides nanhaiensis TaxID=1476871 RepID=A0ABP8WE28_9ACTN